MIEAAGDFDVRIASGFNAFKGPSIANGGGDSCKAGLRIIDLHPFENPRPAPSCDVHPTPAGHHLLAKSILRAVHGTRATKTATRAAKGKTPKTLSQ